MTAAGLLLYKPDSMIHFPRRLTTRSNSGDFCATSSNAAAIYADLDSPDFSASFSIFSANSFGTFAATLAVPGPSGLLFAFMILIGLDFVCKDLAWIT